MEKTIKQKDDQERPFSVCTDFLIFEKCYFKQGIPLRMSCLGGGIPHKADLPEEVEKVYTDTFPDFQNPCVS